MAENIAKVAPLMSSVINVVSRACMTVQESKLCSSVPSSELCLNLRSLQKRGPRWLELSIAMGDTQR